MNIVFELLIGLVAGIILTILICEYTRKVIHRKTKRSMIMRIRDYHFHHSFPGLILVVVSLFIGKPLLFGMGMGVIIRHTRNEKRLTFIDKS